MSMTSKYLCAMLAAVALAGCCESSTCDSDNNGMTASAEPQEYYNNPILPGYNPDPSICRAGDYYYLCNSSFEWFPGLPIRRSKDLVNWELIGYALNDPSTLDIKEGVGDSGGLFAPTIRYNNGTFYVICTHVNGGGNFMVTAKDPAGPWTDPIWFGWEPGGIDPSLFFDDDGKCYYVSHGNITGTEYVGHCGAVLQELDLKTGKIMKPQIQLTHGHAINASYAEGPHLYKINGKYMLLVAEGGTGFYHSETQFYSDSIWGPYVPSHINPVLTHRHLGNDVLIQGVGHADIIETQNNEWWMVALGTRYFDGTALLARETFLVPMKFDTTYNQMTLVVNPGKGIIEERHPRPNLPWTPVPAVPQRDEFDGDALHLMWNTLRTPAAPLYSLADGILTLQLTPKVASKFEAPALVAQRITGIEFTASTTLTFASEKANEEAGMILYRGSKNFITCMKQGNEVVLTMLDKGEKSELARQACAADQVTIAAQADGKEITFTITADGKSSVMDAKAPLRIIGQGTFNGPMIGLYATSNSEPTTATATFDYFEAKFK